MRIAQVAPVYERLPPRLYGGTERVVSYLTEELVALGHDVTVFASGDSRTRARLISVYPEALRLARQPIDDVAVTVLMLEQVMREADQFDVIHAHLDYLHLPMLTRSGVPLLTTLHGRLDLPHWPMIASTFAETPLASISFAQRRPIPDANWIGTVYHGLPADAYSFHPHHGEYLLFLGRISPEKRVDRAVEIARMTGMRLKVAAKIGEKDHAYFDERIAPLLEDPLVEFVGEVGETEKDELLGNAYALLFPIDWPEPFGLVLIEAMASGTPVIAYRHGSVPELVQDGVTGFVVDDLSGAVRAVERVIDLDRATVRAQWETRFTARRMACDYLELYQQLIDSAGAARQAPTAPPLPVGSAQVRLHIPAPHSAPPPMARLSVEQSRVASPSRMADNHDLEQPAASV
jgi:glycosyltransferase involved in cell wall biosynthesis